MNDKRGSKHRLVRKNYLISVVQKKAIKKEVKKLQISESEIVRRAIDGYFFKKRRDEDFSSEKRTKQGVL
jgi:hypothetical protein